MFIWQAEQLETRKTINRNDSSDIFSEKKNVLTSRGKKSLCGFLTGFDSYDCVL